VIPLPTQFFIIFSFTGVWAFVFMAIFRRIGSKDAEQAQSRDTARSKTTEECESCMDRGLDLRFMLAEEAAQG